MRANGRAILWTLAAGTLWPVGSGAQPRVPKAIDDGERPGLVLFWLDSHGLYPSFGRVAREVRELFDDLGVRIRWRQNEVGPNRDSPSPHIRVVLTPSEPGGAGWRIPPTAMGAVVRTGNERIEALYIFFPSLMRALGYKPEPHRPLTPGQRRDLGRALGRVIAHELIHALAPSLSHDDEGLMGRNLNHSFLLKRRVSLASGTRRAVLEGLSKRR